LRGRWSYAASSTDWDSIVSLTLFLEGLIHVPKEFYECGKQMVERVCGVLRIILRIDCSDGTLAVVPSDQKMVKQLHDTLVRLCSAYAVVRDNMTSARSQFVSFVGDYLRNLVCEICEKTQCLVKDEHAM